MNKFHRFNISEFKTTKRKRNRDFNVTDITSQYSILLEHIASHKSIWFSQILIHISKIKKIKIPKSQKRITTISLSNIVKKKITKQTHVNLNCIKRIRKYVKQITTIFNHKTLQYKLINNSKYNIITDSPLLLPCIQTNIYICI